MSKTDIPAEKLFSRCRKYYKKLYTVCLAVTGNSMDAEKALCALILSGVSARSEKTLIRAAVREALILIEGDGENGSFDCLQGMAENPIGYRIEAEDESTRRAAFLYYACGLSVRQIAKVLSVRVKAASSLVSHMKRIAEETVPAKGEKTLKAMCRAELEKSAFAPDEAGFKRVFEKYVSELNEEGASSQRGKKIFSGLVSVILLVVIGVMLWLGAVMLDYLRTATLKDKQTITEETNGGI